MGGGGGGLQSHFHAQLNCSVEVEIVLRCCWGCDNIIKKVMSVICSSSDIVGINKCFLFMGIKNC